ncbi:phage holin family protein [Roseivivax isoporae]|uniref:Phage holin family protein n=1 Tax=Roseivivax isoporae LMG 25204 TaxID=1449351 RepID=X7F897_9RHOB|nr:phage holin family protein [Roseivivax isoporae]ETX28953.1 hypothetical protein RISW2_04360 [Roseivivax isoporae LMG 25204]
MTTTDSHATEPAGGHAGTRRQVRDTGNLLSEALSYVMALMRGEIDLFRAEIDRNMKKAGAALGMILGGLVLLLVSLNVLAAALVNAIAKWGLGPGWAALLVGFVLLVIAGILVKSGQSTLKLASLAPTRTRRNVMRDAETMRKEVGHE